MTDCNFELYRWLDLGRLQVADALIRRQDLNQRSR
jgi:hypothetical protein